MTELLRTSLSCGLIFLLLIVLKPSLAKSAEGGTAWQQEWEATVKAAENEGQVTVYVIELYRQVAEEFQKSHPRIKVVTSLGASGPDLTSRLMAERRAGKHLADVFIMGLGHHVHVLYPAKALSAIPPVLILPEVKDESSWFGGKHDYVFSKEGYSFIFEKNVAHWIAYNTNLVKPSEITSWWHLTNPKWKGKLVGYDPTIPGAAAPALWYFYKNPALGPKYIEQLHGEMGLVISRDPRQLWDWVAAGKAVICVACRAWSQQMKERGLPLDRITRSLKEGAFMPFGNGIVALINPAPHPNAAKVFINWLLSRNGQVAFQEITARNGDPKNSARIDIPKETVPPEDIPRLGVKYFVEGVASTQERTEAVKIFKEVTQNR